jgi:hypothetical protein
MTQLLSIGDDLAADLFGAAVAIVFGYLLLRHENRGLARLLGAHSDQRILLVLPNMRIRPGGTEGEYREKGYVGQALTLADFESAVVLRDALSDPLARLLGRHKLFDSSGNVGKSGSVEATVQCPPRDALKAALTKRTFSDLPGEIANRNLVLFGGPTYNMLTSLAFEHPSAQMIPELPEGGEWGVRIKAGPQREEFFRGRDHKVPRELALIQSFPAETDGVTVTVCAGTGDTATLASARFLVENWRKISRHTFGKPFAVLLSVELSTGLTQWMVALSDGRPFVL